MKNISILKKIKRCLRKTNHDKKFNFNKIKFTTDLHCSYIDQLRYEHQHYKKASVFFLLKELEQNLYVVFTKRSKNLSSHPGQISFPGGRVDKKDNSLLHAASIEKKPPSIFVEHKTMEGIAVVSYRDYYDFDHWLTHSNEPSHNDSHHESISSYMALC